MVDFERVDGLIEYIGSVSEMGFCFFWFLEFVFLVWFVIGMAVRKNCAGKWPNKNRDTVMKEYDFIFTVNK